MQGISQRGFGSPHFNKINTHIIFSTIDRVSPSRSDNFEFSGCTFFVLISGSVLTSLFHHSILLIFSRVMMIHLKIYVNFMRHEQNITYQVRTIYENCQKAYLLSSRVQAHSSTLTSCRNSPSIIASGLPFIATCSSIGIDIF